MKVIFKRILSGLETSRKKIAIKVYYDKVVRTSHLNLFVLWYETLRLRAIAAINIRSRAAGALCSDIKVTSSPDRVHSIVELVVLHGFKILLSNVPKTIEIKCKRQ